MSDMQESDAGTSATDAFDLQARAGAPAVLVDVTAGTESRETIAHAIAIAHGLQRDVRFLEVLNAGSGERLLPEDPVIWELRRREAQSTVDELAARHDDGRCHIEGAVIDRLDPDHGGPCPGGLQESIIAFRRLDDRVPGHMDDTMRLFLEARCSSLLLVPGAIVSPAKVYYRRILVPLDGSVRGERAIVPALTIARRHAGEVLFVHVIPEPEVTCSHPADTQASDLTRQLREHNRRSGENYLARVQQRVPAGVVTTSLRLLNGGDVRRQVIRAANDLSADLIVMSSHGASGHADVASGSVASFILEQAAVPVLMMNGECATADLHLYKDVDAVSPRRGQAGTEGG